MNTDGSFDLAAETTDAAIRAASCAGKAPVIHGQDGISDKAEGDGHASHYYSITRLATTGELVVANGKVHRHGRELVRSRMGDESARAGPGRMELGFGRNSMIGRS